MISLESHLKLPKCIRCEQFTSEEKDMMSSMKCVWKYLNVDTVSGGVLYIPVDESSLICCIGEGIVEEHQPPIGNEAQISGGRCIYDGYTTAWSKKLTKFFAKNTELHRLAAFHGADVRVRKSIIVAWFWKDHYNFGTILANLTNNECDIMTVLPNSKDLPKGWSGEFTVRQDFVSTRWLAHPLHFKIDESKEGHDGDLTIIARDVKTNRCGSVYSDKSVLWDYTLDTVKRMLLKGNAVSVSTISNKVDIKNISNGITTLEAINQASQLKTRSSDIKSTLLTKEASDTIQEDSITEEASDSNEYANQEDSIEAEASGTNNAVQESQTKALKVSGPTKHTIDTADDLLSLRNETTFTGKITLSNDIEIDGDNLPLFATFSGTFDGNGRTIYIINKSSTQCFITELESKSTIQNLTLKVKDNSIKYSGLCHINNGTIKNCDNYIEVQMHDYGDDVSYLGSICHHNKGTIDGCRNYSEVSASTKDYIGGICGKNDGGEVKACTNSGNVKGKQYVGGINGYNENKSTTSDCTNLGNVEGTEHVGGINGNNMSESETSDCTNSGNVKGTSNRVGGINGYNEKSTTSGCTNSGNVKGTEYVGGINGYNIAESTTSDCTNSGNVKGTKRVGGINGYNEKSTTSDCTNSGNVKGTERVGGINGNNKTKSETSGCTNSGNVKGTECVGGINGYNIAESTTSDCTNSGNVKGTFISVGGINGYNESSTTSDCTNSGNVELYSTIGGNTIEGINGNDNYSTSSNNINSGNVKFNLLVSK